MYLNTMAPNPLPACPFPLSLCSPHDLKEHIALAEPLEMEHEEEMPPPYCLRQVLNKSSLFP